MAKAEFYSACYAIIENENGEVLFQKRANTGFRDGEYQLPSGHIEGDETMKACMIREAKEELGIDVDINDLEVVHISHRNSLTQNRSVGSRVYYDVYLIIKNYTGDLINAEPHKCSEIKFIDINNIDKKELFSYDLDVYKMVKNGIKISEINFD